MNGKEHREKESLARSMNVAGGILVMAIAAFFVILLTNQAIAGKDMTTVTGQITSVDSYNRTISIAGPEGAVNFNVDKSTGLVFCDMNKTFNDLAAGQRVTVNYHESDGKLIADSIDIAPVILACYDE